MADSSIRVKDAVGVVQELATDLIGTVHTPKHILTGATLLTDAQLRATPVFVAGPFLTNSDLRAFPVPISGALTNAELRATAIVVIGPLTDAQLRAAPVVVSGPLTETQLRSSPVNVTEKNLSDAPISSGIFTVAAAALLTAIPIPAGATGVRLFAITKNVVFSTDTNPIVPVAGTLTAGGLAIAGQIRVYRFPSPPTDLRLRSTEAGGGASTDIAVEFFGE